jgi:hypothetical protein
MTPRRTPLRPIGLTCAVLLAALLSACAAMRPGLSGTSVTGAEADCARWFDQLDAVTREANVEDGGTHRLRGFSFLRSDRFLASFAQDASVSPAAFEAWIARLARLDADARAAELRNLPSRFVRELSDGGKTAVASRTRQCAEDAQRALLTESRSWSAAAHDGLAQLAQVPDDYSQLRRVLGVYALTRLPFFAGVKGWQDTTAQTFARRAAASPEALPETSAAVRRYAPAGPQAAPAQLADAYARRQPDALGIPRLSEADEALLLRAYAPDLHIETRGTYDLFGPLSWGGGGRAPRLLSPPGLSPAPSVATERPVMYQRLAYTRHGQETLLQLVYSIWFPERPPQGAVDLLGGPLDSVVLRLTLAPDGTPWLYDSIHSCGCYHLFLPTLRAALRPLPAEPIEWAFVPAMLPALAVGQRVALQLASGTHYVEGLRPVAGNPDAEVAEKAIRYALVDDNALRTLPVADAPADVTRSAFWPSGIVPGTERGERIAFWPMGIESPGAMRQWGRQPTAFVGRRHFDDARLMEQRFELKPP